MKRYLLDTGSASDCIHRRCGVHLRADQASGDGDRLGICTPVLGELFAGVELSATREKNRKRLIRGLSMFLLWPFDEKAAKEFGRLFAHLRRRAGRCNRSTFKSPPSR
jgi:tRNA(fMet)-specific endonuclease VapC